MNQKSLIEKRMKQLRKGSIVHIGGVRGRTVPYRGKARVISNTPISIIIEFIEGVNTGKRQTIKHSFLNQLVKEQKYQDYIKLVKKAPKSRDEEKGLVGKDPFFIPEDNSLQNEDFIEENPEKDPDAVVIEEDFEANEEEFQKQYGFDQGLNIIRDKITHSRDQIVDKAIKYVLYAYIDNEYFKTNDMPKLKQVVNDINRTVEYYKKNQVDADDENILLSIVYARMFIWFNQHKNIISQNLDEFIEFDTKSKKLVLEDPYVFLYYILKPVDGRDPSIFPLLIPSGVKGRDGKLRKNNKYIKVAYMFVNAIDILHKDLDVEVDNKVIKRISKSK